MGETIAPLSCLVERPARLRPGIAVICNSLPPYRLHVQRRSLQRAPRGAALDGDDP